MQVEIKSPSLCEHIKDQALAQGKTPDQLVEQVCMHCRELSLFETLITTSNPEEWARSPMP